MSEMTHWTAILVPLKNEIWTPDNSQAEDEIWL